jgi:hypothetical protein
VGGASRPFGSVRHPGGVEKVVSRIPSSARRCQLLLDRNHGPTGRHGVSTQIPNWALADSGVGGTARSVDAPEPAGERDTAFPGRKGAGAAWRATSRVARASGEAGAGHRGQGSLNTSGGSSGGGLRRRTLERRPATRPSTFLQAHPVDRQERVPRSGVHRSKAWVDHRADSEVVSSTGSAMQHRRMIEHDEQHRPNECS